MKQLTRLTVLVALLLPLACGATARVDGYRVIAQYPHSTDSYTEGFLFLNGLFWEGTGMTGRSEVRVTQPETGNVMQQVKVAPQYFGEGIVDWGPNLYEWTWKSHVCFVYDRFSLRLLKTLSYDGEGWGMTRTSQEVITSDGSSTLRFRDPQTFKVTRTLVVKDGNTPIDQLNELEYIDGQIWANVWHSDRIARISPRDGRVLSWVDLTGLLADNQRVNSESVLNGIAYDTARHRIFVTGKQWPFVFEIKVLRQGTSK